LLVGKKVCDGKKFPYQQQNQYACGNTLFFPFAGICLLWKSLRSSQPAHPRDFFLIGNAKRIGTKRMKDLPVFHK
jgi:hypothetical protein